MKSGKTRIPNNIIFPVLLSFVETSKMPVPARSRDNVLSRREVEDMIADNKLIIIVDSKVLKLDSWIKFHPGGDIAIKHMIGRDATDEVNA